MSFGKNFQKGVIEMEANNRWVLSWLLCTLWNINAKSLSICPYKESETGHIEDFSYLLLCNKLSKNFPFKTITALPNLNVVVLNMYINSLILLPSRDGA